MELIFPKTASNENRELKPMKLPYKSDSFILKITRVWLNFETNLNPVRYVGFISFCSLWLVLFSLNIAHLISASLYFRFVTQVS